MGCFPCKVMNEKKKNTWIDVTTMEKNYFQFHGFDFFVLRVDCNFTPEFNHTMFDK